MNAKHVALSFFFILYLFGCSEQLDSDLEAPYIGPVPGKVSINGQTATFPVTMNPGDTLAFALLCADDNAPKEYELTVRRKTDTITAYQAPFGQEPELSETVPLGQAHQETTNILKLSDAAFPGEYLITAVATDFDGNQSDTVEIGSALFKNPAFPEIVLYGFDPYAESNTAPAGEDSLFLGIVVGDASADFYVKASFFPKGAPDSAKVENIFDTTLSQSQLAVDRFFVVPDEDSTYYTMQVEATNKYEAKTSVRFDVLIVQQP